MSQHHHHDNKGHHHHEEPKPAGWKPVHHDWRFYAVGVLLIAALVLYLLSEDLRLRPAAPATSPAPASTTP